MFPNQKKSKFTTLNVSILLRNNLPLSKSTLWIYSCLTLSSWPCPNSKLRVRSSEDGEWDVLSYFFWFFLMFLITRIGKPPDLLYCRFKSNQNIFLNKVKYTQRFPFSDWLFLGSKHYSFLQNVLDYFLGGQGGLNCSPSIMKKILTNILCLVIYNFPLMRVPSCLSINIFLRGGRRGQPEEDLRRRKSAQTPKIGFILYSTSLLSSQQF